MQAANNFQWRGRTATRAAFCQAEVSNEFKVDDMQRWQSYTLLSSLLRVPQDATLLALRSLSEIPIHVKFVFAFDL
jgi:hypothetical protein